MIIIEKERNNNLFINIVLNFSSQFINYNNTIFQIADDT